MRFKTLDTATHVGAIPEASSEAFLCMEERISGFPQFSNCGLF